MSYRVLALAGLRSNVSAAVIKEARRRQRRRRMTGAAIALVLAGALVAGLAVFGDNEHRSLTVTGKQAALSLQSRSVTFVFLKDETSPADVEAMLAAIRGRHGIAGVTFVSKSAALMTEKQHVSSLVVGRINPVPAAIVVRLTAAGSAKGIRADLKARGLLPGVAAIRPRRSSNP